MSRRSKTDRCQVIGLTLQGHSPADIVKLTGFDKQFVARWKDRTESEVPVDDAPRSGRPSKMTRSQQKRLVDQTANKQRRSVRIMASELQKSYGPAVSKSTVHRIMRKHNLHPYHRTVQSKLRAHDETERLRFATATRNTDWSRVLFADEKKFTQYSKLNNKNDIVWSLSPDKIPGYEVLKGGHQVMVWGAMSSRGVVPLYVIDGSLTAKSYIDILDTTLLPAAQHQFKSGIWNFVHDNAPSHSAKVTKQWLEENMADHLLSQPLPPRSPDLNPIENLWAYVQDKLQQSKFSSKKQFVKNLKEIWKNVDVSILQSLSSSMSNRLLMLKKAKGGHFKLH